MPPTSSSARMSKSHSRAGRWEAGIDMFVVVPCAGDDPRSVGGNPNPDEESILRYRLSDRKSAKPARPQAAEPRDNPFGVGKLGEDVSTLVHQSGFTMRRFSVLLFATVVGFAGVTGDSPARHESLPADPPAWAPKFKMQEIDTGLSIGYAVLVADINCDGKPDIVVVDQLKVVWYENPTWKKRVILDGKSKPDNVCAAVLDIDGDGTLDIVLGAGWKPS